MRPILISILFSLIALIGVCAFGDDVPLRDPSKLWQAKEEKVLRVATARVILADYDLIRKDFPEVRTYSNSQIDQWLIENAAYVSPQQAAQENVNTKIQTTGETRKGFRPREYRRAHVFEASTGGLIDAKGTGAVDPNGGSHDNGLATLGDMLREFAYEKLIRLVFNHMGRGYKTVGSYAVLDFGFSIKHPSGGESRAGIILRQAHVRFHSGPEEIVYRGRGQATMLPAGTQEEIEFALRHYGITSAIDDSGEHYINLQGSESHAVIDYGGFLVHPKFSYGVSLYYSDAGMFPGASLIGKASVKAVQPNESVRVPFEIWGYSVTGKADPKYDNPFIWSHELAEALAQGRASRADVERHLRNMLGPVEEKLAKSDFSPPAFLSNYRRLSCWSAFR